VSALACASYERKLSARNRIFIRNTALDYRELSNFIFSKKHQQTHAKGIDFNFGNRV
jgi:hypothetical protein